MDFLAFFRSGILFTLTILISTLLTILIILYTLHNTVLKPYETNTYLKQTEIYTELQSIIPELIQPGETQSHLIDNLIQEVAHVTVKEYVTEAWIAEKVEFIETELWDYILGKSTVLEPISLQGIRDVFFKNLEEEAQELTKNLPVDINETKIINQLKTQIDVNLNWAELYGIEKDQLDILRTRYSLFQKTITISALLLITLLGLGFFMHQEKIRVIRWSGILTLITSLILAIPLFIWKLIIKDSFFTSVKADVEVPARLEPVHHEFVEIIYLLINDVETNLLILSGFTLLVSMSFFVSYSFTNKNVNLEQEINK